LDNDDPKGGLYALDTWVALTAHQIGGAKCIKKMSGSKALYSACAMKCHADIKFRKLEVCHWRSHQGDLDSKLLVLIFLCDARFNLHQFLNESSSSAQEFLCSRALLQQALSLHAASKS